MPIVIIDRKKKRKNFDNQWDDPFSLDLAKKENARTIEIEKNTDNVIEKFLLENPIKSLMGKKVWAYSKSKDKFYEGWIRDIYPSKLLLVKINDRNIPLFFTDIISLEG